MIDTRNIKNIIFDFGGVLIGIDTPRVISHLLQMPYPNMDKLVTPEMMEYTFGKLERDIITTESCYQRIRDIIGVNVPAEEIDHAWNLMLGDLPKGKIELLAEVRKNYNIILISNSNSIHFKKFLPQVQAVGNCNSFNDLFDRVFFSHELHLSKPNPEIFEYVLSHENLKPQETIFIDDLKANVEAATSVGIQGVHLNLEAGQDVRDLFQYGLFRPQFGLSE